MGLWGNTAEQPAEKKKLANISDDQVNSNQQAQPVKYLAGRAYVAGDFISPAYNPIAKPIKNTTGKNETSTTGYKYFADFALVFCMGGRRPVDAVYKVIVDNDIIWKGNVTRTVGTHKEVITMPDNRGILHLWWGTDTQGIDNVLLTPRGPSGEGGSDPTDATTWPAAGGGGIPAGNPNPFSGHYDQHPAYRGQCYGVFKNWKLGRDRTSVPNIQLELKRGCAWISGSTLAADNSGINPIAVLFDVLTDERFGMAVPEANLDTTNFTNALNALATLGVKISPLISSQTDFRQFIAELMEYYDGWIRRSGTKIQVGFWGHGTITSVGTLTDDDLLAEPELEPKGWGPTKNEITVVYKDKDHHFNDYPQTHRDPNNFRITGGPRPEVLQRPWLTDAALAKRYAREAGAAMALPFTSGDLTVKREWLTNNNVLPGTVITYNSGFYGLSFLLRVLEIEHAADSSASAKITVDWERSKWPAIYIPPPFQGPGGFFTGPRDIYKYKITEIPYILTDRRFQTQVIALAVRGNVESHGMRIWVSFDAGSTYTQLPSSSSTSSFASYAQIVSGDFLTSANNFDVQFFGIDQDEIISQLADEAADDRLLCFIDNEIISIENVDISGGGPTYNCNQISRARYGSVVATHTMGTDCFFIFRDRLMPLDHVRFTAGTPIKIKLQAFTSDLDFDIASISPIDYTIVGFGNIAAPVFFPSPGSFVTSVAVDVSDPPSGYTTRYTTDGSGVSDTSRLWPQSGGTNTTITISANTTFRVRFFAPNGRSSNEVIGVYTELPNLSGVSGAPAPPLTQCGAPTWSFSGTIGATSGNLTLTNTTSGATIKYSKNGGATTTYSSPLALVSTTTTDVVEFWAIKTGLTDSVHRNIDNTHDPGFGGGGGGGGGNLWNRRLQ